MEGLKEAKDKYGFDAVCFGDIFLEETRQKNECMAKEVGVNTVFPLWGKDTKECMDEILEREIICKFKALDTDLLQNLC